MNSLKDNLEIQFSNSEDKQSVRYGNQDLDRQICDDPKVLMYHRIVDNRSLSESDKFCLHVDDFEQQLKVLDLLGYTPITFKDYKLFQERKLRLPKKPIILTFDDGYKDFYRLAYPVMQEKGMKGVVFVLGDRSLRYNRWDSQAADVSKVSLMTDEEILELHSSGFEIGAHSISHSNLKTLNVEDCYSEVYKSKMILEALLDSPVISFCYPYGLVNDKVKKIVDKTGFHYACSVFSGPVEFGQDPLEIRRMAIHNKTTLAGFVMRLVTPYEYLEWVWWKAQNTV